MSNAVIFVPADAGNHWITICAAHSDRREYHVTAVARNWCDVVRLLKDEDVEVVVVGTRDHLPPGRPWRIEAVTEQLPPAELPERRRPTRR